MSSLSEPTIQACIDIVMAEAEKAKAEGNHAVAIGCFVSANRLMDLQLQVIRGEQPMIDVVFGILKEQP